MAKGWVESGFGRKYIENEWEQWDWDLYHFNLNLKISIGNKVVMENRNFTKDERNFILELEEKMDAIRNKYKEV